MKKECLILVNMVTLSAAVYANDVDTSAHADLVTHQSFAEDDALVEHAQSQAIHHDVVAHASVSPSIESAFQQGSYTEALGLGQQAKSLSHMDVAYLAKAARQTNQYSLSEHYYNALAEAPEREIQKEGVLGNVLVQIDQRQQDKAQLQAYRYVKQFGVDEPLQDAANYYQQTFQTALKFEDETKSSKQPSTFDEREVVLTHYKQAAKEKRFTTQHQLLNHYPQYFHAEDQQWLQVEELTEWLLTSKQLNAVVDAPKLQQAREQLHNIYQQTDKPLLKEAALSALVHASIRLDDAPAAISAYQQLKAINPSQVTDTQVLYANALIDNQQAHRALSVYNAIAKQDFNDGMTDRYIAAQADIGNMSAAKKTLAAWQTPARLNDFTHNYVIDNPYAKEKLFWGVRLADWDGEHRKANRMIDAWLKQAPADSWALQLKGDLKRWQGMGDSALQAYDEAAYYLHDKELEALEVNKATVYLDQNNVKAARQSLAQIPDSQRGKKNVLKRLAIQDSAQLTINSSFSDTTSPASMNNEWGVDTTLYAPRTQAGHRAYVEHDIDRSPDGQTSLQMQRVGVGAQLNFYPTLIDVSVGHGIELNDRAYAKVSVQQRFNQYLTGRLAYQKNSEAAPLKALNQGVYVDSWSAGLDMHLAADVDAGLGVALHDFDDGNKRKEAFAFISSTLWQQDRWSLKNYTRLDWQRNDTINQVAYYNPEKAWSYGTELSVQYQHPFDGNIKWNHVLTGGVGRYQQSGEPNETTWLVRYGQSWDIKDSYSLAYHLGRKRSVYDGKPEYNNFIGLSASMRF